MTNLPFKQIAMISALVVLAGVSYYTFSTYKPKIISQLETVKGAKNTDVNISYPQNAQEMGSSKNNGTEQITLKVPESTQQVQNFYKNILIPSGWKLYYQQQEGNSLVYKYKNDDRDVVVTASEAGNEKQTIVGIEISNH